MRFAAFWLLLALPLIPLGGYLRWRYRRPATITFPSARLLAGVGRSWRQRLLPLPWLLRLLAIALVLLGLARPQAGMEKISEVSKGIAIEMVVDRSGSMAAEMEFGGRQLSRLEVVKRVFAEFVNGNKDELGGRASDLIGLITFARHADTVCPLTLAHGALDRFLDKIAVIEQESPDNRTAIGDAVALAAARLKTAEESLPRRPGQTREYEIKSKAIILLTDGENNAGSHLPEEAAALAKKWGIKIYAIGVGGDETVRIQTMLGPRLVRTGAGVDRKTLAALAESTGGIARVAEDGAALRAIYKEIDQLERSEMESVHYVDYREYFSPFILLALLLLSGEIVLRTTLLRKIP